MAFTFQSGSIQMHQARLCKPPLSCLYIPIWFYSNESFQLSQKLHLIPLHSNLVLFKWLLLYSGPAILPSLHSNLVLFKCDRRSKEKKNEGAFTFQSGSMQIHLLLSHMSFPIYLYIPIWFYSNGQWAKELENASALYIPIWFYSNLF